MKAPKKKPPTVAADKGLSKTHAAKFTGTDNPRHLRAIAAVLRRPMPREALDKEAGCSNAPELVADPMEAAQLLRLLAAKLEREPQLLKPLNEPGSACNPAPADDGGCPF